MLLHSLHGFLVTRSFTACLIGIDIARSVSLSEQALGGCGERERHGRLAAVLHWRGTTLGRNDEEKERQRKKRTNPLPRGRSRSALNTLVLKPRIQDLEAATYCAVFRANGE